MPRTRLREVVVCAGAFAIGAAVALFAEGPALFADGDFSERLVVLGVSVVAYLLLGVLVGALAPGMWKVAALCLVLPLAPVAALLGDEAFADGGMELLLVGFLLGDTAAVLFGAMLGARLRQG